MKGVSYIMNEKGKKTALVIDLEKLRKIKSAHDFMEELEDTLDIVLRSDEPAEDWKAVRKQLLKKA
jgi:hypothetical protein